MKITNIHTFHANPYYGNYHWRFDCSDVPIRHLDNHNTCSTPLPVHGIPMRAKDTLLADRLKAGLIVQEIERLRDWRYNLKNPSASPRSIVTAKNAPSLIGKLLGVEIEYYPSREPDENALTNVTSDGSLSEHGREVRRLTWADKTGRLTGLLNLKLAGKVDKRCGLHVHVDARHLGENGLLDVSETYEKLLSFQPHLKKLVPRSRHRNDYCHWRDNRNNGDRYSAINYRAFREHGTIEFRCQSGTTNLVKIESWALLCQFLLNWCAKPENVVPRTWAGFIAICPEPLRSWCILRKEKLYGQSPTFNERSLSAIEN